MCVAPAAAVAARPEVSAKRSEYRDGRESRPVAHSDLSAPSQRSMKCMITTEVHDHAWASGRDEGCWGQGLSAGRRVFHCWVRAAQAARTPTTAPGLCT